MSSAKLSFLNECGVSKLKFSFSHSCFPTEPSPKPHPLKDDLLVCVCTCIHETERSMSHYVLCACGQEQVAWVGSVLHAGPKIKLICHHTGGQRLNFLSHFTRLKKKRNQIPAFLIESRLQKQVEYYTYGSYWMLILHVKFFLAVGMVTFS